MSHASRLSGLSRTHLGTQRQVAMARRVVLLAASAAAFAPGTPHRTAVNLRARRPTSRRTRKKVVSPSVPVPASLTKPRTKTAAGEMAQTREIPGWRQKDWKKVPLASSPVPSVPRLKIVGHREVDETEVHSAITGLGVEVVGQAQLVGDVEEIMQTFARRARGTCVKIDIWPEERYGHGHWDDGTLAVEVEQEAKDQSTRDKALEARRDIATSRTRLPTMLPEKVTWRWSTSTATSGMKTGTERASCRSRAPSAGTRPGVNLGAW